MGMASIESLNILSKRRIPENDAHTNFLGEEVFFLSTTSLKPATGFCTLHTLKRSNAPFKVRLQRASITE
jgi:hypothetical protein